MSDTMKAITVEPMMPGSARLENVAEPDARDGSVLVEAIAVGVCGTDVEIVEGKYGWAPPGIPVKVTMSIFSVGYAAFFGKNASELPERSINLGHCCPRKS